MHTGAMQVFQNISNKLVDSDGQEVAVHPQSCLPHTFPSVPSTSRLPDWFVSQLAGDDSAEAAVPNWWELNPRGFEPDKGVNKLSL